MNKENKTKASSDLVREFWGVTDYPASERNFYYFPAIQSRSCRLIFGEDDGGRKDWCEYWTVEKYLKDKVPVEKCLSICCGFGHVERHLAKLKVAKRIVGTDIAPQAVQQARERANQEKLENIDYYVGDLIRDDLPEGEYDIIWANGALHHIADLETVVPKLWKALRPNGCLIANDYVGPQYMQVPPRQQEIINAAKHLLPSDLRDNDNDCRVGPFRKYRRGRSLRARLVNRWLTLYERLIEHMVPSRFGQLWEPPSLEDLLAYDPSECVGSPRIIPVLKQHFSRVEVREYRGSVLFYALDAEFYKNYDARNAKHRRSLEMLCALEDALIDAGELQSDNAHMICWR